MNIKERNLIKFKNSLNSHYGRFKEALTLKGDNSHLYPAKIIKSTDKPLNVVLQSFSK